MASLDKSFEKFLKIFRATHKHWPDNKIEEKGAILWSIMSDSKKSIWDKSKNIKTVKVKRGRPKLKTQRVSRRADIQDKEFVTFIKTRYM